MVAAAADDDDGGNGGGRDDGDDDSERCDCNWVLPLQCHEVSVGSRPLGNWPYPLDKWQSRLAQTKPLKCVSN